RSHPTAPLPGLCCPRRPHRLLPSFPTRRSSDLIDAQLAAPTSTPVHGNPKASAPKDKDARPTATAEYSDAFWNMIRARGSYGERSEEHTSELQSRFDLVCRLLLEKKNLSMSKSD